MTPRQANLLTAAGLLALLFGVSTSAPRWAPLVARIFSGSGRGGGRRKRGRRKRAETGPPVERQINVKLFFQAADRPGLVIEEREVALATELSRQVRTVVEELARGSRIGLQPTLPAAHPRARGLRDRARRGLRGSLEGGRPGAPRRLGGRADHRLFRRELTHRELPGHQARADPGRGPAHAHPGRPRGPHAPAPAGPRRSGCASSSLAGRCPRHERARVSQKAARFTESVIREMTRLANLHGAVNLSQGFPDFAGAGRGEGGGAARGGGGREPVRHHLGRALAAAGHRRASSRGSTAARSTPSARSPSPAAPPRP